MRRGEAVADGRSFYFVEAGFLEGFDDFVLQDGGWRNRGSCEPAKRIGLDCSVPLPRQRSKI
jgi:hypothetical protein